MANVKATTRRASALKSSTAAVGDNSKAQAEAKFTNADEQRYRDFGAKAGNAKVDSLVTFMRDVHSGKFDADANAKQAATAYARGSANDVNAGAQGTMSAAYKKCAHVAVLNLGIDAFVKACDAILKTGNYPKSKTGRDRFDSIKSLAMAVVDAYDAGKPIGIKAVNVALADKALEKTGSSNNSKSGKADKAKTAIRKAVNDLTPKAGFDAKESKIVAQFFALMKIKPEEVKKPAAKKAA